MSVSKTDGGGSNPSIRAWFSLFFSLCLQKNTILQTKIVGYVKSKRSLKNLLICKDTRTMSEMDQMIQDFWGEWIIIHTFKEFEELINNQRFRVISIGNLLFLDDNTKDMADYIKYVYDSNDWIYPIVTNNTGGGEFKKYLIKLFGK